MIETQPRIRSIRFSKSPESKCAVYAKVQSRTRDLDHTVVLSTIRGWTCGCEDYLFTQQHTGGACDHIKVVRTSLFDLMSKLHDLLWQQNLYPKRGNYDPR